MDKHTSGRGLARTVAAWALAVGAVATAPAVEARIVKLEIQGKESPTSSGQSFGQAGQYERIFGKAYGELSPNDPHNEIITDLKLAPRNARGMVEYNMTFSLVKPIDMSKANGVLFYSVVNRGNGTATPNEDGRVSLVAGWQGDVTPTANNQTMQLPIAKNPDGSRISGPFVTRWMNVSGSTQTVIIPRNEVTRYPTTSMNTANFTLNMISSESMTGVQSGVTQVSPADWAFADCSKVPFPGTPDTTKVCLRNGFDATKLYELLYTVYDPIVAGIGLAATRDISSFFRYEATDDSGNANPVAGKMKWGLIEGSSQSGTFVKLLIMLGFNLDEKDRMVWEGANPNIAARVTDLNRRFALPGGLVVFRELAHEGADWYMPWPDAARGRPTWGVLARCMATSSCPKIIETFGSTEIYGLRHSFVLVGTDAKQDLPIGPDHRRYYMASSTHGGGPGGFSLVTGPTAGCLLPANVAPTNPMRAAVTVALVDWVTKGTTPPPSVYPKLSDQTLVANTSVAMGAPQIPGTPPPDGLEYPLLDYDVGAGFNYLDQSGVATKIPTVLQVLPQVVPAVDRDGNELVGLKSPLLQNPLGTYLGYNTFPAGFQKGQTCIQNAPAGGYVAFAETKAAREAVGDPRPSLEERYGTRENWLAGIKASANAMVAQRYLLRADADQMIAQSEASDVMKARPTVPTQTVVEYYWAAKDQYFYTAHSVEIASLDASANWKRTGQSFKAFVSGSSQGQGTAVCRNYGTSGAATDAHLFSVNATECTSYTTAPLSNNWTRETANAFEVALPYSVTGACPKNTVPVYRVDNNRGDTNARYTTELATKASMVAKGYKVGGFGPTGVGMCSPV
jgi:Alpha/beta hydrolase domain